MTHIDFGFMLMNSPGSVGFELAPFKMPQEYIDVLGGMFSEKFADFRDLVKLGFLALRKRADSISHLVEIMEIGLFCLIFRFQTAMFYWLFKGTNPNNYTCS